MSEVPQAEQELLAGAERRLGRIILLLVPVGTAIVAWRWDAKMAVAFAFGGVLAYLNYCWMVAVVDALLRAQQSGVPRRTYFKLFLPLGLLVAVLYVIFARSLLPVVGVLSGLFLLVAGVLAEAVYEVLVAARR